MVTYGCTHNQTGNACDPDYRDILGFFTVVISGEQHEQDARLAYITKKHAKMTHNTPLWIPAVEIGCPRYVIDTMCPLFADEKRVVCPRGEIHEISENSKRTNIFVVKKQLKSVDADGLLKELDRYRNDFMEDLSGGIVDIEEHFHAAPFGDCSGKAYEMIHLLGTEGWIEQMHRGFELAYRELYDRVEKGRTA